MMKAVLSNADHPEYGVATIPLPVPRNQYDHCVVLLEALEIGDASESKSGEQLAAEPNAPRFFALNGR